MGDKLQWEARGSGVPPINIITIENNNELYHSKARAVLEDKW